MRDKNLDYNNTEMTKLEATFSKKSRYDQTKSMSSRLAKKTLEETKDCIVIFKLSK